jgi:hypothetical protein
MEQRYQDIQVSINYKLFKLDTTGRRKIGRPETRWKEGVFRAMEECGLRDEDWEDRLRYRLGV